MGRVRHLFLVLFSLTVFSAQSFADDFMARTEFSQEIRTWPDEARLQARELCTTLSTENNPTGSFAEETRDLLESMSQQSPTARRLLEFTATNDPVICQYAGVGQRGFYDSKVNMIAVEDEISDGQKMVILAHEMKHLQQNTLGFERTIDVSRAESVRFTFAVEADAQAIATLVAWELREAGDDRAWQGLMDFPNYRTTGEEFEAAYNAALSSPANPNEPYSAIQLATTAAFGAWMRSDWLTSNYRLQALSMYLDELDKTNRIESYNHYEDSYYESLCYLTDEFNYPCLMELPQL